MNEMTFVKNADGSTTSYINGKEMVTASFKKAESALEDNVNITPTTSEQTVTPQSGYDGFKQATVSAVALEQCNVTPTTSSQTVSPTSPNVGFSEVNVSAVTSSIDSNIQAENIKKDVQILGVTGTLQSGSAPNIEFSLTAPEDTTKLWVKTSESKSTIQIQPENPKVFETSNLANIPASLDTFAGTVLIGNYIYVLGGTNHNKQSYSYKNTIYKYDISTNTYTTLEVVLPMPLSEAMSVAVDDIIYIFGGYNNSGSLNTILKFDTTNDTITTLTTTMPYVTHAAGYGKVGNYIYILGGYTPDYSSTTGSGRNTILKFDIINETISTIATTLPRQQEMVYVGSATVGTNIYIIGGWFSHSICKFDTLTETVTELISFRSVVNYLMYATCVSTNNAIYCVGGSSNLLNTYYIYVYDFINNKFYQSEINTSSYHCGAEIKDNILYRFGGVYNSTGSSNYSYNYTKGYTILPIPNALIITSYYGYTTRKTIYLTSNITTKPSDGFISKEVAYEKVNMYYYDTETNQWTLTDS